MNVTLVSDIGSAALLLLAATAYVIAFQRHYYCRYGREMLALIATWLPFAVIVRYLAAHGYMSIDLQRVVNSVGALVFLAIAAQLIILRWVEQREGSRQRDYPAP